MDESPNDLDQLFKEAAQNAAGLAHVLDPTTAIERGTRRRRFARRRRGALSGLVVLVAVVVFLVPLPQLHLFGSSGSHGGKDQHQSTTSSLASTASTPATSSVTGTGPLGGVIPADFQPGSFTAVSLDEWWMLGSARCLAGSGTCGAIVRTTDGGSKFAGIPSPPVSSSEVTQLRFANALDGYAFDPELWQTTNGGTSWVKVATPGPVAELEAADGEAYALGCDAANCRVDGASAFAGRIAQVAEGLDARAAEGWAEPRRERHEPVRPGRRDWRAAPSPVPPVLRRQGGKFCRAGRSLYCRPRWQGDSRRRWELVDLGRLPHGNRGGDVVVEQWRHQLATGARRLPQLRPARRRLGIGRAGLVRTGSERNTAEGNGTNGERGQELFPCPVRRRASRLSFGWGSVTRLAPTPWSRRVTQAAQRRACTSRTTGARRGTGSR